MNVQLVLHELAENFNNFALIINYRPNGEPPGFLTKAVIGMAAGVVGAFVGTPAEV